MRNILKIQIIALVCLLCTTSINAENREKIETRVSTVLSSNDLKKEKFKEVKQLIFDLDSIQKEYNVSLQKLRSDTTEYLRTIKALRKYELYCSGDSGIFSKGIDPDAQDIPQCLRAHFKIIHKISQLETAIKKTENYISQYREQNGITGEESSEELNKIKGLVCNDFVRINNMFIEIDNKNLSTLSKEQSTYLDNLYERFNKLSKYY